MFLRQKSFSHCGFFYEKGSVTAKAVSQTHQNLSRLALQLRQAASSCALRLMLSEHDLGQQIYIGVLGAVGMLHCVLPHHCLADGAVCRAVNAPVLVLAVEVRVGAGLHG
jgi:hypothetical protein